MGRHASPVTHLRGILILLPWVLYLLLADVLISVLLPLRWLARRFVYDVSSLVASSVWAWIQLIFTSINGARIVCSGDSLPSGESAVVVSNHVAWSDFYMIQALAQGSGMLGYCRYFAKRELRIVPFLGWGLWAMGMPMVSRNWLKDKAELDRVFSDIVNDGFPTWLISFSEGTRFTEKKYEESKEFCEKKDKKQPKNLLYPRTKGFITTVQHLRQAQHVKAVYVFTVMYESRGVFQLAPSMWETLSVPGLGAKFKFHVHAKRYLIDTLPQSDNELATWLEQRWVESGEWLESQKRSLELAGLALDAKI